MATIYQPDEEKDQQAQTSDQSVLNQTGGLTGTSSPTQGAQPTNNYQQPKGSGRFTNVQKYLQANKGAGEQIAGQITKQGETEADKIRKGIESAQTGFGQQEQNIQSTVNQGFQSGQQLFANPIEQNQQQVSQFQQVYNPYGLQQQASGINTDISGVQQGVQNLQNLQQQAQTESGRFNLLRDAIGGPKYTQGQRRLDQLFLQATPAAKNISQQFGQLATQYGQQASDLGQDLTARKSALENLIGQKSQELQNLYTGGTTEGLEGDIAQRGLSDIEASSQQRLEEAKQAVAAVPELRERLANNQLTADDISNLGLTSGQTLYDVNLADYISKSEQVPTLAGVANPEEFARYQALRQLVGKEGDIFSGANQAGGFQPYQYNKEGLQQQINKRAQDFADWNKRQTTDLGTDIYNEARRVESGGYSPVFEEWFTKGTNSDGSKMYKSAEEIDSDLQAGRLGRAGQLALQELNYYGYPNLSGYLGLIQRAHLLAKEKGDFQSGRTLTPLEPGQETGGYFNVN